MKNKVIKAIIALSLAIVTFLQPLQIQAYFMPDKFMYSRYYNMDKETYTKHGNYGDISEWTKCGNFYYERFDPAYVSSSGKNYITIRRVEEAALENGVLTIPSELDGYQVLGVGAFNVEDIPISNIPFVEITGNSCILEKPELLRKIVFSEGIEVIGRRSFQECNNLKQVSFPESLVYIAYCAFNGCKNIAELALPQGIVLDDCVFDTLQARKTTLYSNCTRPVVPNNNKKIKSVMYIKYYEKDDYDYIGRGYLEKLYIDPGITKFNLSGELYEIEKTEEIIVDFHLKKLIINAGCTNLKILNKIDLAGIYTIKGAKAIKEARKHSIPYYIKKTGKTQTVEAKKNLTSIRLAGKR